MRLLTLEATLSVTPLPALGTLFSYGVALSSLDMTAFAFCYSILFYHVWLLTPVGLLLFWRETEEECIWRNGNWKGRKSLRESGNSYKDVFYKRIIHFQIKIKTNRKTQNNQILPVQTWGPEEVNARHFRNPLLPGKPPSPSLLVHSHPLLDQPELTAHPEYWRCPAGSDPHPWQGGRAMLSQAAPEKHNQGRSPRVHSLDLHWVPGRQELALSQSPTLLPSCPVHLARKGRRCQWRKKEKPMEWQELSQNVGGLKKYQISSYCRSQPSSRLVVEGRFFKKNVPGLVLWICRS